MTWEIPTEYQLFLDQNAAVLANSNAPHMWQVCYTDTADDGDGNGEPAQRYYVNEYTRIVSWDKPVGFVESTDDERDGMKVKAIAPAAGKNVIKRRKVQPKLAVKSENPFSKPTEAENV